MPKDIEEIQEKILPILKKAGLLGLSHQSTQEGQLKFTGLETLAFNALGVSAVILFGSRALGVARPNSDFDFGVLLKDPKPLFVSDYKERAKIYYSLYNIFSSNMKQLLNIDIVFLQKASAELRSHVAKRGVILYENSSGIFADFREAVMNEYADFEPERNIFHQAILTRIP